MRDDARGKRDDARGKRDDAREGRGMMQEREEG
jgi:hypothetical protein